MATTTGNGAGAAAFGAPLSAAEGEVWKASPAAEDCEGPLDGAGRSWTDPKFDDSTWAAAELPEIAGIPAGQDRYYRLHFRLATVSSVEILISADDSLSLYANGKRVGAWGAEECHGDGAAGELRVDLTAYVRTGENVLAAHVSNGPGDSLFQAALSQSSMTSSKVVPFLDLPYSYDGSNFAAESTSADHGGRVTSYFDHQYPGSCGRSCQPSDTRAVHFYGYEGGVSTSDGAQYDVYYNGHSGTDFALPAGRPVLAAANGVVTFAGEIASVCSDGRTRSAKVIRVLHPNGYTTEYWHLSSFAAGIEVGSAVTRSAGAPIGYAGDTGCTTGPHLHFAVYTPSHAVVDPYAWDPRPDTPWYGKDDPWRSFGGPSRYLWVRPLTVDQVADPATSTLIYSPSAAARVEIPAGASGGRIRVKLAEGLPAISIPNQFSLYLLSASGYLGDGKPFMALDKYAFVEVRVPATQLRVISQSKGAVTLVRWDPQAERWTSLPTAWDSTSRIARAATNRLGTFALVMRTYRDYLPLISRPAPPAEPDAPPPLHRRR